MFTNFDDETILVLATDPEEKRKLPLWANAKAFRWCLQMRGRPKQKSLAAMIISLGAVLVFYLLGSNQAFSNAKEATRIDKLVIATFAAIEVALILVLLWGYVKIFWVESRLDRGKLRKLPIELWQSWCSACLEQQILPHRWGALFPSILQQLYDARRSWMFDNEIYMTPRHEERFQDATALNARYYAALAKANMNEAIVASDRVDYEEIEEEFALLMGESTYENLMSHEFEA